VGLGKRCRPQVFVSPRGHSNGGYTHRLANWDAVPGEYIHTKRREAEQLKKRGYASETLHEFPYVVQYADYAGVSIRDAAEEILFRATLDDQLLAKTEILRIRYFDRVKKADTPEAVHLIIDDYMRDSYFNGAV